MLTQESVCQLRKLSPTLNQSLIRPIKTASMATSLRHPVSVRAETAPLATVEELIGQIAELVRARQTLRAEGAPQSALEHNRRELVSAHWDLSHALIARHCPKRDAA